MAADVSRAVPSVLLGAALAAASCATHRAAAPVVAPGAARARVESASYTSPLGADAARRLREECGIELVRLATTAGGEMLELRYVVRDLERARLALEQPLRIEAPGSGEPLEVSSVIKLGTLMTKPRAEGRVHHALFRNTGRGVIRGAAVVLVAGDRRYEGVTVE